MKIARVLSATGPVVLAPVCGSFFHTHHGHHGTFSGVRVSKRVYFFFFSGVEKMRRTQASMLAPLSTFGSASMLSTESKIFSMDCTGDQRSADDSYTVWKRSKSQICPTYCSDHHQRHEEC